MLLGGVTGSNLLTNPSFETHSATADGNHDFPVAGTGWTGTAIGPTNSAYTPATPFPDGSFVMIAQNAAGDVSQSVNFPVAGTYLLTFSAAGRAFNGANPFNVLVGSTNYASITPVVNVWNTYSVNLTNVAAGTQTLDFDMQGVGATDVTTFLDKTSLTYLNSASTIPTLSAVTVAGGAKLDMQVSNVTVGSLSGSGTVTNGGTGPATLAITGSGAGSFAGTVQSGGSSGPVNLTINMAGSQTFSGPVTLNNLTVTSGTLLTGPSMTVGTADFSAAGASTVSTGSGALTIASQYKAAGGLAMAISSPSTTFTVAGTNIAGDTATGAGARVIVLTGGTIALAGSAGTVLNTDVIALAASNLDTTAFGSVSTFANLVVPAHTVFPVPVNGPIVTATGGGTSYAIGNPPTAVDSGIAVADNSASVTSATVSIAGWTAGSADILAVPGQTLGSPFSIPGTSITVAAFNSTTGQLLLTGTDTPANYQSALRSVTFQKAAFQGVASRTISFTISDTHNFTSAAATKTISIAASAAESVVVWQGGGPDTNWSNGANWVGGSAPDSNDIATFNSTGAGTVVVDVPITVGAIDFIAGGFTVVATGSGALTLTDTDTNYAVKEETGASSNTITAPILLTGSSVFDVAGTTTLTASGAISGSLGLTKTDSGTLAVGGTNIYTGATSIAAGTMRIIGTGSVPAVPVGYSAYYSFDNVSGGTVVNGGSAGAADNGVFTNGADLLTAAGRRDSNGTRSACPSRPRKRQFPRSADRHQTPTAASASTRRATGPDPPGSTICMGA